VLARNDIRHINGAIAEAHGYADALESGQLGIQAPGKVTLPGPDYITFDPAAGKIVVWDSKFSSTGKFPTSAKGFEARSWLNQVNSAIQSIKEPMLKEQAQKAFSNGMIEWKIYTWPK
jgi:filamentous hemagglutinin